MDVEAENITKTKLKQERVLRQDVGSASTHQLHVARCGLLGVGVVIKAVCQGINAGVALSHQIRKCQVQFHESRTANVQLF